MFYVLNSYKSQESSYQIWWKSVHQ